LQTQLTIQPDSIIPDIHLCHYQESTSGLNITWRTIDEFELVYITHGSGRYQMLEKSWEYRPGTIIFTPPHIQHRYVEPGKNPSGHWAIHFRLYPGIQEELLTWEKRKSGFEQLRIQLHGGQMIPYVVNNFQPPDNFSFNTIQDNWDLGTLNPTATSPLKWKTSFLILLTAFFDHPLTTHFTQKGYGYKKSLQYIHKHAEIPLSISLLSDLEGVTVNHYSAQFTKIYGITPTAYIRAWRIRRARELLLNSNLTVKQIAPLCGFEDQFYLSRVFKKEIGISPTAFRDRHRL